MAAIAANTLTRRAVLAAGAALPFAAGAADADPFAALEAKTGGRIGVAVLDTGNGRRMAWRDGERFTMCSTFKFLAVATVLKRIDAGLEAGDRLVRYAQSDILEYAPITKLHIAEGMTVSALCAAAISYSDNTAANLLLHSCGGPAGVTGFARRLGDPMTRLDRFEPALNVPDGDKDTTTPAAMLADLGAILLGNMLSEISRKQLTDWMIANTTGAPMLRAGLPANWTIGDKTGHGSGAVNDIAIATPPGRAPILISIYTMGGGDAVVADIGRIVAARFG